MCDRKRKRNVHLELVNLFFRATVSRLWRRVVARRRLFQPCRARAHVHRPVPLGGAAVLILLVAIRERDDKRRDRVEIFGDSLNEQSNCEKKRGVAARTKKNSRIGPS